MRVTQVAETLDYRNFENMKSICMVPQMGKSNILQYQIDGNFNMLPLKLYPSYILRTDFNKVDLHLKAYCVLPASLRIKELTVKFRVPETVQRVYIHQKEN